MPQVSICTVCGKTKKCAKNRKTGELTCHTCNYLAYYHNVDNWKTCKFCAKLRYVSVRTAEGEPVCPSCYRIHIAQHKKCLNCGNIRHLVFIKKYGMALCSTCRSKYRMRDTSAFEICAVCRDSKPVAVRNALGKPICYLCLSRGKIRRK
jgi:hypothetical protein